MRCPKCKFISYDDLATCAKCSNDLSALSAELNGTCNETNLEFFLGPIIQSPSFEEDSFSESQALPPIDHGDINFDDTSTGGFPALDSRADQSGMDFDDSVGVMSEDDVEIELGDIMPVDLDQLDATSVMSGDIVDTMSLEGDSELDMGDSSSSSDAVDSEVDLEMTGELDSSDLGLDFDEEFSDIDLDDTNLGMTDDTSTVSRADSADDTVLALDLDESDSDDAADGELDLDEELIAELADSSDGLDTPLTDRESAGTFEDMGLSGSDDLDMGDTSLDLGESLDDNSELDVAGVEDDELSSLDLDSLDTGEFGLDDESSELELDDLPDTIDGKMDEALETGELSVDLLPDSNDDDTLDFSESPIEDLTGEFPPIEDGDAPELSSLDLSDIDVSDLVSSSDAALQDEQILSPEFNPEDTLRDQPSADDSLPGSIVSGADDSISAAPLELADDELDDIASVASGDDLDLDQIDEEELASIETDNFGEDKKGLAANDHQATSDEDIPEVELVSDEDEGPPDLPT